MLLLSPHQVEVHLLLMDSIISKELMRPVVIDNVISSGYQEYVENIFSINFSWFFTPRVSDDVSEDSNTGFSHPIFEDKTFSKHYDALLPIFFEALDKKERGLKPEKLIRIRAGMFIQNQTKHPHLPHIDFLINI